MKGLILSGGKGTRLRPLTHTSAKQLVPVANKPVLFYGIEAMAEAGIRRSASSSRRRPAPRSARPRATARSSACGSSYIEQDAPRGLAHAVLTAEEFLGDSPFVMYLGDNLLRDGIVTLVDTFTSRAARRADPAHARAGPRELRRGGARRRQPGVAARGEAEGAEDRPRAGGRLHVHAGDLRRRALDRALLARRARDHRRDPDARGPRPARGPAHRGRLVEGHRPGAGHARGEPADPRRPGRADRRRAGGQPRRGPRRDREGRPAGAHDGPRARR